MDTEVGRRVACEGGRHIVDVTPALVVVDHAAHRQLVRDQGQIEDSGDVRIRVTARGHAVTSRNARLGLVELRLVRDIADDAGLSSCAEQRSLGPLKHLNALEIGCVHIQVAAGQLTGLLVQIDGNVREAVDRAAGLSCDVAGAETPHEDLILAWPRGWRDHIGQVLEQIVEVRDIQLLQGIASKRLDCDRHVLGVLTAPLGGHDDFLDAASRRPRLICRGYRVRGSSGMSAEDRGNRTSAFLIDLHWQTPPSKCSRRLCSRPSDAMPAFIAVGSSAVRRARIALLQQTPYCILITIRHSDGFLVNCFVLARRALFTTF